MKPRGRHPNRSGRPGRPSKSHKTERSERHPKEGRHDRNERSEPRKTERSDYRNKKPAFSARSETTRPRADARRPAREDRPREDVREAKPAAAILPTNVQTVTVTADENGMRVDRFFESRFPGLSFSHIQRIIRKGEVRVNGKRAQPRGRLEAGQSIRIPPLRLDAPRPGADSPA
ncbi:MAG TPA: S4 domain-containing protein, partial [Pseudorhodoplanes sp.]|nr:S4 domain-containing protein [Pseudorhodoplanes sp.]